MSSSHETELHAMMHPTKIMTRDNMKLAVSPSLTEALAHQLHLRWPLTAKLMGVLAHQLDQPQVLYALHTTVTTKVLVQRRENLNHYHNVTTTITSIEHKLGIFVQPGVLVEAGNHPPYFLQ